MSLVPGQILDGKYRIVRVLGQGAMGAVFEGENTRIRRRVAIKVLHAQVAARTELVQRFEREAQAAGRIGSAHIVEVLDLGELEDGARYLVMEYLDGESLRARIPKRKRVAPATILPLLRQLLVGLGAAHQAGIVHRDLKPDNIFVLRELAGQKDFVKIVDFGVSKFESAEGEQGEMTRTGIVMGTPYYMSPEQARGAREVDARSDLFSVGVILYEAVTGRVPFDGATFNDLMFKIALEDAPSPESIVPDLDPGIARLVRRALTRDVDQRFQSAAEFQRAIEEWLATGTTSVVAPAPSEVALQPPPDATMMIDPSEASISQPLPSVSVADSTQLGATLQAQPSAATVAPTVAAGPVPVPVAVTPSRARWPLLVGVTVLLGAGLFTANRASRASRPEAPSASPATTDRPDPKTAPDPTANAEARGQALASTASSEASASASAVSATAMASASAMASATATASATASAPASTLGGGVASQPSSRPVRPKAPPAVAPTPTGDPVAGGRRLRTF